MQVCVEVGSLGVILPIVGVRSYTSSLAHLHWYDPAPAPSQSHACTAPFKFYLVEFCTNVANRGWIPIPMMVYPHMECLREPCMVQEIAASIQSAALTIKQSEPLLTHSFTANKKAHSWILTRSGSRSAVWGRVGWQGWKGRGSGGSFKRIRGKGKRNCGSVRLHSPALHKRQNWFNFHLSTSTYPLLPHDWPRPLACPQIAWFSRSRIHNVIV